MSYTSRIREQNKENKSRIKREQINKLVIPIGAKDSTIRIYVPPKPPDTRYDTTQHKSTLMRMIDDFHANLPPASEEDTATYTSTRYPSTTNTARVIRNTANTKYPASSSMGSVASFDYHDIRVDDKEDKSELRDDQYETVENSFSSQYILPYKDRTHKLIRNDHNKNNDKYSGKDNKDGYKSMSNMDKHDIIANKKIDNTYKTKKDTDNNTVKSNVYISEVNRNVKNMKKECDCRKTYQPIKMDEPPPYYEYSTSSKQKQETEKL